MKTKATHYGTCQLCGSLQKLPDGVLALHGYQVEWHQFHGSCRGSGHLPFEQSKDIAEQQIALSEEFLAKYPVPERPPVTSGWNSDEQIAYRNAINATYGHRSMLRFLKPRCAGWKVRPLKEVGDEDAKAETVKVASRNVRQLASLRNDAKSDLSRAIDAVDKIVGWSEFGCLNSSNCVNVATRILASNGTNTYGHAFDMDEAEAAISHLLTAQAVWLEAKAAADEAKAAFEADKKAALQARGAAGGDGDE
jgi:hypothetical protein